MVHIEGRRWFQKSYGNTYHTVRIFAGSECIYTSGKHYGYDEQYLQTAFDWMLDNGYPELGDRGRMAGTRFLREELDGTYSVIDVARERDL